MERNSSFRSDEILELYGDLSPSEDDLRWTVVHTKPKREKKLAEYALKNHIFYYLPLMESIRLYQYRKVTFTKPMFSGYFFVKCNFKQQQILVNSGHIVNFLKIDSESEFLSDLHQIKSTRDMQAEFCPHPYLESGLTVKFTKGPFKGVSGLIKEVSKSNEVVLQIKMLRQAVSMKADPADLVIIQPYEN
ncbi:MAG: transcription termination/antitermination NusG family protein [Candidatus Cloacimonetes bacterium]|nr:transcription termination/antitermination NusG family protein [Candidatus Cloacimonadota bacterium]